MKLIVEDRFTNKSIGQKIISLQTLSEDPKEIDQMTKDKKYDLDGPSNENGKIRLKLHWIYSKVSLLEDILKELNKSI